MTLIPWRNKNKAKSTLPAELASQLEKGLESSFGSFFKDRLNWLGESVESFLPWSPAVNVGQTEDAVIILVELPGMTSEQIEIEISGGVLTVSGEKQDVHETHEGEFHTVESRSGSFRRMVGLPDNAGCDNPDSEKIDAKYEDGVLRITIPKIDPKPGKKIDIR